MEYQLLEPVTASVETELGDGTTATQEAEVTKGHIPMGPASSQIAIKQLGTDGGGYGVNLICVEDGIDSSKESGKLMISVLSDVAEVERENIRAQTMAGRAQKAREGKWNGGFAPYGDKLENGLILIAEDEAEVILIIYEQRERACLSLRISRQSLDAQMTLIC